MNLITSMEGFFVIFGEEFCNFWYFTKANTYSCDSRGIQFVAALQLFLKGEGVPQTRLKQNLKQKIAC